MHRFQVALCIFISLFCCKSPPPDRCEFGFIAKWFPSSSHGKTPRIFEMCGLYQKGIGEIGVDGCNSVVTVDLRVV